MIHLRYEIKKAPKIHLQYDGSALSEHKMDVSLLAPALMAFGDLFKEANRVINGDKAKVNVLVNADIKANCVTLSLDIVQTAQTAWDTVKSLLQDQNVASAKDLIDWLLIPSAVGGGSFSLFQFLKWKGSNRLEQRTTLKEQDNGNTVIVNIIGDGNSVEIPQQVYQLSQDKKVIKAAQGIVAPVAKKRGIETAAFYDEKDKKVEITKEEAERIVSLDDTEEEPESQYIVGHITVYKPELSATSKRWNFLYNGNQEEIDISETSIAKDVLARGKIVIGDSWKVKMEVKEKKIKNGYKNDYRVVEVFDFIPGQEQTDFNFHDNS